MLAGQVNDLLDCRMVHYAFKNQKKKNTFLVFGGVHLWKTKEQMLVQQGYSCYKNEGEMLLQGQMLNVSPIDIKKYFSNLRWSILIDKSYPLRNFIATHKNSIFFGLATLGLVSYYQYKTNFIGRLFQSR